MHSLSLKPLTATRNGNLFWSPKGPAIEPFPIKGDIANLRRISRDLGKLAIFEEANSVRKELNTGTRIANRRRRIA